MAPQALVFHHLGGRKVRLSYKARVIGALKDKVVCQRQTSLSFGEHINSLLTREIHFGEYTKYATHSAHTVLPVLIFAPTHPPHKNKVFGGTAGAG